MLVMIGSTPAFRCRFCRSRKCAYDLLPGYDVKGHIVHRAACRVRWDMAARRLVELDFYEFLDARNVPVAQYGADRPAHKFLSVVT